MSWLHPREENGDDLFSRRKEMVEQQLRRRGIHDEAVLAAMEHVPREAFVSAGLRDRAFADGPLPIGHEQTISQPYVVATMSAALRLRKGQSVLEIGTGSGYQTAILAEMGLRIHTLERIEALAGHARSVLESLGYTGINFHIGDGHLGWPEGAPYDGIIVTAAAACLPPALVEQLSPGGRLVIPVGTWSQDLRVYRLGSDGSLSHESLYPVRFVPLLGGTE